MIPLDFELFQSGIVKPWHISCNVHTSTVDLVSRSMLFIVSGTFLLFSGTQLSVRVLLGNFPSVFYRRFALRLARGDLVRSVTENTLEIGLCCCVVESCFHGFLRLNTLLLLFLCCLSTSSTSMR